MSRDRRRPFLMLILLLGVYVLIGVGVAGYAGLLSADTSSCVTCHLDQDTLEETASEVKAGGSALQSGAG